MTSCSVTGSRVLLSASQNAVILLMSMSTSSLYSLSKFSFSKGRASFWKCEAQALHISSPVLQVFPSTMTLSVCSQVVFL